MRTLLVSIAALAWSCSALLAQNLVGSWQGTLAPPGGKPLRTVVKITRSDDEKLKAAFYSIDQGGQALNASTVTLQGSTFKMVLPAIGGEYEGRLSEDANTITGNWTQGGPALPLVLVRASAQTAWAIPEPPPPPKLMPADAKPVFDVSTVKLSAPDARGSSILVGRGGSNLFTTTNTSVKDLIIFAYGLHAKQLIGGPAWMESEHFDITGKPDLPGMPSAPQLMSMVQKLIQERFQLSFHREKKELSVYAITVAKGGPKLTKTEVVGASLPGFGG
ncbi:MAG: hypothetical protein JWN34_138, partial [Bryobacterales bacterium]|nr:hypothetical protein [Bryobacterales bacterium]